jgi:hypothetical protein
VHSALALIIAAVVVVAQPAVIAADIVAPERFVFGYCLVAHLQGYSSGDYYCYCLRAFPLVAGHVVPAAVGSA